MRYSYITSGTCTKKIEFDLEDGKISNIEFTGGCPGNLNAIRLLLDGADADYVVKTLLGNQCGSKGTSCADQLAKAVSEAQKRA